MKNWSKILNESNQLLNLEELILGVNFITDKGVKEWAGSSSTTLKNIKTLILSDNKLTDDSLKLLVQSSNFCQLESLDIGWMEAGNETAKALGKSDTLQHLKKIELERSYVDLEGVQALVDGKIAGNLEELNLVANKFGDAGAKVIAGAANLKNLKANDIVNVELDIFGKYIYKYNS